MRRDPRKAARDATDGLLLLGALLAVYVAGLQLCGALAACR